MRFVNDVFEGFADCFVGAAPHVEEIAHPEQLRRELLDYSVQGLKHVDDYLEFYKFIANGPEDSVHFYVACEVRG
jgi:hypothetical protein